MAEELEAVEEPEAVEGKEDVVTDKKEQTRDGETESTGSDDESEAPSGFCLHVLVAGQVHRVNVPTVKGVEKFVASLSSYNAEEHEAIDTDDDSVDKALLGQISRAFTDCDSKLADLLVNQLPQKESVLDKLYKEHPKALFLLRTYTKMRQIGQTEKEKKFSIGDWQQVEAYDVSQTKQARHYSKAMLAEFASLNPGKEGVRLIVLETPVVANNVYAMLRFCAYYREHRRMVQLHDEKRDLPLRADIPEDALDLLHTFFGFTTLHKAKDDQEKADGGSEVMQKLHRAQDEYMAKRFLMREKVLLRRLPALFSFVILWMAKKLLNRIDRAKQQKCLPPRLYIRLHVERSGSFIDMDQCVLADENDIEDRHKEAYDRVVDLRTQLALAQNEKHKNKDKIQQLGASLQHNTSMLEQCERIRDRVQKADPVKQVLLHVAESGERLDKGITVEVMELLTLPIDKMRAAQAEVDSRAEEQAAKAALE